MRKGRYVINDVFADIDCITKLNWSIDVKNTVSIKWSWPRNGGIKLAAVFCVDNGDDPLEFLLEKHEPIMVTKDMYKDGYTCPLDAPRRVYRIFPAYFGEGTDIIIMKQEHGTATDAIVKVVSVIFRLEYKPVPLSEYRRANITIKCSDVLPDESALSYSKYRDGARICDYPLSGDGTYACYIKKNEQLRLYVPEEYNANVILYHEKS